MRNKGSKLTSKSRAGDALDDIECMLDTLLDVDTHVTDHFTPPNGSANTPDVSVRREQESLSDVVDEDGVQKANTSGPSKTKRVVRKNMENRTKRMNESHRNMAPQQRVRKHLARAPRSSIKPSVRKSMRRTKEKDISPLIQALGGITDDQSEHSSEEKDDQQFLHNLKRMAEQRRQIEKRRRNARNAQVEKKMKVIMGQTEERMRELIGSTANKISKAVQNVAKLIPNTLDDELKALKATAAEDKHTPTKKTEAVTTLSDKLQNELKSFQTQMNSNEEIHNEKIENATALTKKSFQKRRDFRGILVEVEQVLQKGHPDEH
ncbi:unnamed protein product [Agarophyton chilense]